MLEVNAELDLTTSDDTFNLQMDLFQRTELAYLPEATVAFVINQGSDSRPKDFERIAQRFNKLVETQNHYLDKYPNSNYREMLSLLLDRANHFELDLTRKEAGLAQIGLQLVTIYLDRAGKGFNEEDILQFPLAKADSILLNLPEDCATIRVDLSEIPNFFQQARLLVRDSQTEILPSFTNGIILGEAVVFPNPDPQLVYPIPREVVGHQLQLDYQLFELDNLHSDAYIGKVLAQYVSAAKAKLNELQRESIDIQQQNSRLQKELEDINHLYNSVIHSRRWTIPTKIINFLRRKQ